MPAVFQNRFLYAHAIPVVLNAFKCVFGSLIRVNLKLTKYISGGNQTNHKSVSIGDGPRINSTAEDVFKYAKQHISHTHVPVCVCKFIFGRLWTRRQVQISRCALIVEATHRTAGHAVPPPH